MRAPLASQAARNEPEPLSLRFVTWITLPPRPPVVVSRATPSAPGNAGAWAIVQMEIMAKTNVNSCLFISIFYFLNMFSVV